MAKMDAHSRWVYNARDCAATIGAWNVLSAKLNDATRTVYKAQMALEACTLAIQCRGIKIDLKARERVKGVLNEQLKAKKQELDAYVGHPLNPNSPDQVRAYFYGEMDMKEMKNKDGRVSVDQSILERIKKGNVKFNGKVKPKETCANTAKLILDARSVQKDLGMVKAKLDKGRMRCSLNVGATESFRFSSSKTNFGTGANLQQVKHVLREMFIPDDGMLFGYGDQDRAESTVVAHLSGDEGYVNAHRASDTHVEVAKLIWPDAGWTGDDELDLELAEQPNFIRFYSRRDMSKRTQHALNYYPTPCGIDEYEAKGPKAAGPHRTLARLLGIKQAEAHNIALSYFRAFPGIRAWQESVIEQVKRYRRIYFPGGSYRDFFGRPWDAATHREAISCIPQFVVAWTNHIAMYRLWSQVEVPGEFEVLMHNHDAIVFQCDDWDKWKGRVAEATHIEWPFVINWSWAVGRNWKEVS